MKNCLAFGVLVGFLMSGGAQASTELVANGGFETGNLSGWASSGLGNGTCPDNPQDFNVSTSGSATGCFAVSNPSGSTYAAYVMNDGTGPLDYVLSQTFSVATGTTGGIFSFDLSTLNQSDANRTLTVSLTNQTTLASYVLYAASTFSNDAAWQTISGDVSAFLAAAAGDTVLLSIDNYIPGTWTGPAGLGIDNVSIRADVSDVPEPASLALIGLGFIGLLSARRRKAD